MRYLLIILLVAVFASPLSAATYSDALGRRLVLSEPPRRIISLSPNVTEIIYALGAEKSLVAVTDACTYPAAAQELPQVGRYAEPSLEQMLLMRPDLVIAAADMNRPELVKRLEQFGIPVYVVYPRTIAQTIETIEAIGAITGHLDTALQLKQQFTTRLSRITKQLTLKPPVSALICVMLEPLVVAGTNTFVGDVLRHAGGINPVPTGSGSYPTWNMESLLQTDPEVIIISAHPGQPDPLLWLDAWPQLRAVRHQRVHDIDADWIHRPGPRMILGIEALAKALHPDIVID